MPPPYVPGGQGKHTPGPGCVLNVPIVHREQSDVILLLVGKAPGLHSHADLSVVLCEYIGHVKHTPSFLPVESEAYSDEETNAKLLSERW